MPPLKYLLRAQKKDLFDACRAAGFNPAKDFKLIDADSLEEEPQPSKKVAALLYKGPPSGLFVLDEGYNVDGHVVRVCQYSPAAETTEARREVSGWPETMRTVKEWLRALRVEVETPDVWAAIGETEFAGVEHLESNSDFTADEILRIKTSLAQLGSRFAEMEKAQVITRKQLDYATATLDHVAEMSSRLGRKDWLAILLGNVLYIASATGLDGQQVANLAGEVLSWLLRGQPLLGP